MTAVSERTSLDLALERATVRLLELQHPSGWWVGELESNATMIAQHLFWHHVLNLRAPELDRKIANELLARQREDGTWSIWFDGPPDLSTSVEAYAALKLAGVDPGPKARDYIRSQGGVPRTRIFTKCFLALLGQWPWNRIVPIPVELILLPANAYVSIYNFSCWARGTFVPLSVCRTLRPVRGADVDLQEIGARPGGSSRPLLSRMKRVAIREAERWVRDHQEADGSWGGIQPPWVWSILMLASLGHGFEDETLRRAVEGWEGFTIDEGDRLRPEACQSPVWDTGLAVLALRDSGLAPERPAQALEALASERGYEREVERGRHSLLEEQEADGSWFGRWGVIHIYGTAAALPALEACGIDLAHPAFRRAVAWLDSVQNEDGGFGEDIRSYADPAWRGRGVSTPSQTAWALLAYVAASEADSQAAHRTAEWLCSSQRPNGDWDEQQYTGTGFPLDFMISYHLYRLHFPLLALGRLRERLNR